MRKGDADDGTSGPPSQAVGNEPEFDQLPGMSKPALQALHAAGYTHLDQLATVTEADLGKLHGMGPKALGVLRDALHARGKSFRRLPD